MNASKPIPEDILHQLRKDFKAPADYQRALELIQQVSREPLNVGWVQLSRALILISAGDVQKMKSIIDSGFYGDPRDVILQMMALPGHRNDHGMTPFDTE